MQQVQITYCIMVHLIMTKWDGPTSTEWVLEKNADYREADT